MYRISPLSRGRRRTCRLALLALLFPLMSCSGGGGGWPSLAIPPAPRAPAPLPPVAEPSPAPVAASREAEDAETAAAIAADLGARLDDFAARIALQKKRFEAARDRAMASGSDADRRSAEFELSRLSQIESELAGLLRRLDRLPPRQAVDAEMLRRLGEMRAALGADIERERARLAAKSAH
ncbi:MAG: hypothetical protein D6807_05820 [Alphaproteobacteria bacterium]|nr:MAG: hypothetical protein D6807_05820 [Alphaproteobacteria bacterium]